MPLSNIVFGGSAELRSFTPLASLSPRAASRHPPRSDPGNRAQVDRHPSVRGSATRCLPTGLYVASCTVCGIVGFAVGFVVVFAAVRLLQ